MGEWVRKPDIIPLSRTSGTRVHGTVNDVDIPGTIRVREPDINRSNITLPTPGTEINIQQMIAFEESKNPSRKIVEKLKTVTIEGDEPRFLTEAEKDFIVFNIPPVRCPIKFVSDFLTAQIKSLHREMMDGKKLAPSKIYDAQQALRKSFEQGEIEPQTAVGIRTADAIGSTAMQTSLSAFHQAGVARGTTYTFDDLKNVMNVSEERKNNYSFIHFKDRFLNIDQVLAMKGSIVGVTVKMLVTDFMIDAPDQFESWPWLDDFVAMTGTRLPPSSAILRLQFNPDLLYQYRITLEEIAYQISTSKNARNNIVLAYSSIEKGIIDVYPIDENVTIFKSEFRQWDPIFIMNYFLAIDIVGETDNIMIKGIQGLDKYYPIMTPVISIILKCKKFDDSELNYFRRLYGAELNIPVQSTTWVLYLDWKRMKRSGIVVENLVNLFRNLDPTGVGNITYVGPALEQPRYYFEKVETHHGRIIVNMPTDIYGQDGMKLLKDLILEKYSKTKLEDVSPTDYIKFLLDRDQKMEEAELKRLNIDVNRTPQEISLEGKSLEKKEKSRPVIRLKQTPLKNASEYCHVEVSGRNLTAILAHPYLDERRCYSNNPKEMYDKFGIGGCWTLITMELDGISGSKSSDAINHHHILMISDTITNRGFPTGYQLASLSKQPIGGFTLATASKPLEVMSKVTAFGGSEKSTMNTNLALGQPINIGSGGMDVIRDPRREEAFLQMKLEAELAKDLERRILEGDEDFDPDPDELKRLSGLSPEELGYRGGPNIDDSFLEGQSDIGRAFINNPLGHGTSSAGSMMAKLGDINDPKYRAFPAALVTPALQLSSSLLQVFNDLQIETPVIPEGRTQVKLDLVRLKPKGEQERQLLLSSDGGCGLTIEKAGNNIPTSLLNLLDGLQVGKIRGTVNNQVRVDNQILTESPIEAYAQQTLSLAPRKPTNENLFSIVSNEPRLVSNIKEGKESDEDVYERVDESEIESTLYPRPVNITVSYSAVGIPDQPLPDLGSAQQQSMFFRGVGADRFKDLLYNDDDED